MYPLKQGLRLIINADMKHHTNVKVVYPLKQGLRLHSYHYGKTILYRVKVVYPLKQGLRRCCFIHHQKIR